MFRECEKKIQKWIDSSNKALLIFGARQVGKTYIIRKTLEKNKIDFFEINLLEREDILNSIKSIDDASLLSERLALYSDKPLTEKKSVIFIDEIQKYPDIITKIKFLVDEGRFRYILSGSNLGVELEGIRSVPVGYMEQQQMYPMNFYEFTVALGISENQWDHVKSSYDNESPVDELIHERFMRAFYYYLVSGGMPDAVKNFISRNNLLELKTVHENIINQYKADFIKYETADKRLRIISIYDAIPSQLRKQDLRFVFTYLDKELKFDRYEQSFLWLKDAGTAIPVYQAQEAKLPLVMSKSSNRFKLFNSDVGLLVSSYPQSIRQKLLEENIDGQLNNGALFENFVAQELTASEIQPYYYKRNNIGEIDFMIEKAGHVLPLEVKSGSDFKKHKALDNLMQIKEFNIRKAIVLSTHNVEREEKLLYLPIYMTFFLKEKEQSYSFTLNI